MLIVSYVGFNEQEVKAQSNMVITLSDEAKSIDEVVVVGYGVFITQEIRSTITDKCSKLRI